MEAVPRMPMISLELKNSLEYVDFAPTLKQYIRDHYGEDPALYNKACSELEQLRQNAIHISHDFMGCSTLKKYFAQLQFLQGRFPMTEGGEAAIPFTWEDVHSGREVTLDDIKFEQASILYNIGALHSVLGAMDTRQSADQNISVFHAALTTDNWALVTQLDKQSPLMLAFMNMNPTGGMKVSCTHFQCASWAFEYLRDHFGCAAMSLDMSHEVLTFQVNLMLAQAQECILEKSMTDSRKSTITAKVAAQIVEFYRTTLKNLETCHSEELISSRRYKEWKKRIDLKILFYTCITHYYMGRQSEDQQKWGLCLAYYTQALEKLNECQKLAKGESQDILESLRFTNDVVGGKHQAAKKDNDFVYHDKVPAVDTLPEVKGASLVKGIPFNSNDPEVSGPDIFQKLVPMSAHEASSLYSEEKATLLRRTVSEITEKNEELQKFMDSLQLDPSKLNPEQERLPQQLLEKCAALSVRPDAIKDLVNSMGAVSNVATDVDLGLKEVQQLLEEETKSEEEFQDMFGKRTPNVIIAEIAKELQMFEEGHKKGSQSNNDLHKAMNTHINNLKLLSSPLEDLQKLLPSLDKVQDSENADVIKELNLLLGKVEEMKTQRKSLEEQLRQDIQQDDITNVLVTREGVNREVLFSEQLKKHEKITSLIRQNLSAQINILRALTDANARYASVRKAVSETIAKRDQTVRDLINSYDVYEDLMAKSKKGLEFYKKLETNVGRLLARCRGVCKVQQEEREQIMNRYKPKAPSPARPAAPKPSPSDSSVAIVPAPQPHPTIPPMFEGPKLKDYLPFMKPKTFGKKEGDTTSDIPMDPTVAAYMSRTGSLPSSGTASPVPIPGSGSLPASPDHYRHRLDGPDRLRQPSPGAQIQYPDFRGPVDQGQGPADQQIPPGLPRGRPGSADVFSPSRLGLSQGQVPDSKGQIPDGPSGPKMRRDFTDETAYGSQNTAQQSPGQGQLNAPVVSADQYVPLNQKWKQDSQGPQVPPASSFGPVGSGSETSISRSVTYNTQIRDRHSVPMSAPGADISPQPSSSPAHSMEGYIPVYNSVKTQEQVAYSKFYGMIPRTSCSQRGYSASQPQSTLGRHQQPLYQGNMTQTYYGQIPYGSPSQQLPQQRQQVPQQQQLSQQQQQLPQQQQQLPQQQQQQWPQQQQQQLPAQQQQLPQQPQQLPQQQQQLPQQQQSLSQQQQPLAQHRQQLYPQQGIVYQQQQSLPTQEPCSISLHMMQPQQPISVGPPHMFPQHFMQVSQQQMSPAHFQMTPQSMPQQQGQMIPTSVPQQQMTPQQYLITSQTQQGTPQGFPHVSQQQQGMPQQQIPQQQPHQAVQQQLGVPQQMQQMPQQQGVWQYTLPWLQQHQLTPQQQQQFQQYLEPLSQPYSSQAAAAGSHGNIPQQQVLEKGKTSTVGTLLTPVFSSRDKASLSSHGHTPHDHSQGVPHQPMRQDGQGQMMGNQTIPVYSFYMGQGQRPLPDPVSSQAYGKDQKQVHVQGLPVQGQVSGQSFMTPSQSQDQYPMSYGQNLPQGQQQTDQGVHQTAQGQSASSSVPMQPPGQNPQNIGQGQRFQQPKVMQTQQIPQQQQIPQSQMYQQQTGISQPYPVGGQSNVSNAQNRLYSAQQQFSSSNQQVPLQSGTGQTSQWQVQGQYQNQMQNKGPIPSVPQGQIQGEIPSQAPSSQTYGHSQGQVQGQPQLSVQNQTHYQNQQARPPVPPYSQTEINRALTQQIMSQDQQASQTNIPSQQTILQGQFQGNQQQQYSQGQQGQGHQMYGQHMVVSGYQQGMAQNQQSVQQGYRGQVPFNQLEQAHLPSPLQPQPVAKVTSGQGQDLDKAQGQQGQGLSQGQQLAIASVPPQQQQPQLKPGTDKGHAEPNIQEVIQEEQNVEKWTPLNVRVNVPHEPPAAGRVTGPGMTGPIPGTPIQGEQYISPLSSVKSTPTHSRENSQGKFPETSAVTEPLPTMRQLSTASSLDEILSSSPDSRPDKKTDNVLAPKVLTAQEIQQQKEDQLKNSSLKHQPVDPYKDKTKLDRFVTEVEKLAKLIEGFEKPTCSGPTQLDLVWKELMEEQDKAVRNQSLAIARCYPMKNREQDIMPYDNSRVLLTTASDDYINASWINDLSPSCPKFIATQSPLPVTLIDFWCMVYEQGVEVLVTLSSDIEVGKKFPVYWPEEKGKTVHHGSVHLTLQSKKDKPFWTERIIHLTHSETRTGRTLVHLHYNGWPVSGFPDKVSHLLQFITEVHSFYRQQRSLLKPVLVHCSNGIGRSGMFILTYVGMQTINYGNGIVNLAEIGGKMLWRRRNLLHKKDQIKFCYEAVLYYAQDILAKQGILVHKASFGDRLPAPGEKAHSWEPTEDILFGSASLTSLQTSVEKLGIKSSSTAKLGVKVVSDDRSESPGSSLKVDVSDKLDEKLQRLKDETNNLEHEIIEQELVAIETNSQKASDSLNLVNLPDVVQRPSDSLEHRITKETEKSNSDSLNVDILGEFGSPKKSVPVKDTENQGSATSLTSLGSDHFSFVPVTASEKKKSISLSGSPLHRSREGSQSPVTGRQLQALSSSLADLQDPKTFTIGASPKGKKKITKADFLSGESTIKKQEDESGDPLSSLDPLWSLK